MQEYLIVLRPARAGVAGKTSDSDRSEVDAHFAYLQQAKTDGVLILAGRTQENSPMGLVVIRAPDLAEAVRFAQRDPAVHSGVFGYEVKEYAVALMEGRSE